MKRMSNSQAPRFRGGLRHYHRAKSRRSTWDQWINGYGGRSPGAWRWVKILLVLAALLVLGGIIAALTAVLTRP